MQIDISHNKADIVKHADAALKAVAATLFTLEAHDEESTKAGTLAINATTVHLINTFVIGLDFELLCEQERAVLAYAGVTHYYDTAYNKKWMFKDDN